MSHDEDWISAHKITVAVFCITIVAVIAAVAYINNRPEETISKPPSATIAVATPGVSQHGVSGQIEGTGAGSIRSSRYDELAQEEASIPVGRPNAFASVDELTGALHRRGEFVRRLTEALRSRAISRQQIGRAHV